jgi:hypothetical protein
MKNIDRALIKAIILSEKEGTLIHEVDGGIYLIEIFDKKQLRFTCIKEGDSKRG